MGAAVSGLGSIGQNIGSLGGSLVKGTQGVFNSIGSSSIGKALGSSLGPLFGASGGVNGTGRPAPTGVPIEQGTTSGQIGTSYGGTQNSLASQQALLAALQAQGAFGAQTSALQQQQGLANQLGNAGGVQNLSGALGSQQALAGQQQGLASQYGDIAAGRGPNPALAALNQATGQNVANQSALMAGQRGAGSNVGLIARQAAQQGAATQQQAVGQAATTQAQQSLAALSGEQAQQQAIGQTNTNVANIAAQQVAQQQAQQQALAGQSNALAGQQIGATTANTQAQQSEQQLLQNALAQYNQQQVSMQGNINAANAGLANTNMQGQQAVVGGLANSLGGGLGSIGGKAAGAAPAAGAAAAGARGGEVKKESRQKMAEGGDTWTDGQYLEEPPKQTEISTPATAEIPTAQAPMIPAVQTPDPTGPQSSFGKFLHSAGQAMTQKGSTGQNFNMAGNNPGAQALQKGFGNFGQAISNAFQPGMSTTPASPANAYTGPDSTGKGNYRTDPETDEILASARGGLASRGGKVDAKKHSQKAVKKGNSYDNDKIPAYLSEGEVVIPRSIMQGRNPTRGAADFVAKVLAKKRRSA